MRMLIMHFDENVVCKFKLIASDSEQFAVCENTDTDMN